MIDQDKTRIMEAVMRDQEWRFVMNNIAKPATGETQGGKPCDNCERGWGGTTLDGTRVSCKDNCGELNEYRSKHPRICDVLGVEVEERFSIDGYPTDYGPVQVCEDGKIRRVISEKEFPFANDGEVGHKIGSNALYYLLNHPDRIIRKPHFTEEEVADARAIVRVLGGDLRALKRTESGELIYGLLRINRELLPSLRPGQSVALSEICGC